MPNCCPDFLSFAAYLKQAVWGGTQLTGLLGKQLHNGQLCAESWELFDRKSHACVIDQGSLAGMSIQQALAEFPREIYGKAKHEMRFPLMLKFLDVELPTSIQVHPTQQTVNAFEEHDSPKTEAWYVIATSPQARIHAGLKQGLSPGEFQERLKSKQSDEILDCLNEIQVVPGDCLLIPAGVVHTMAGGLVVAEVQQSSELTYRVHDWNRGRDSYQSILRQREKALHAMQSLAVESAQPIVDRHTDELTRSGLHKRIAHECFELSTLTLNASTELAIEMTTENVPQLLMVISGAGEVCSATETRHVSAGQTLLKPASTSKYICRVDSANDQSLTLLVIDFGSNLLQN